MTDLIKNGKSIKAIKLHHDNFSAIFQCRPTKPVPVVHPGSRCPELAAWGYGSLDSSSELWSSLSNHVKATAIAVHMNLNRMFRLSPK